MEKENLKEYEVILCCEGCNLIFRQSKNYFNNQYETTLKKQAGSLFLSDNEVGYSYKCEYCGSEKFNVKLSDKGLKSKQESESFESQLDVFLESEIGKNITVGKLYKLGVL